METCLLVHHGVTSVWVDYLRKALWVLARHFGATSLEGLLRIVVDQHLYYQYEKPVGRRHQLMWAHYDGMPRVNHYERSPPNNVAGLLIVQVYTVLIETILLKLNIYEMNIYTFVCIQIKSVFNMNEVNILIYTCILNEIP